MRGRSVSGDAHVGRRMDADIGEAFRKGRARGQEFGLPGLRDGVDDDKGAKARRDLSDSGVGGGRGRGKDRHEARPCPKHHLSLKIAGVHGLGVGENRRIRAKLARRGDGADPETLEKRRADLDDVGDPAHLRDDAQAFRPCRSQPAATTNVFSPMACSAAREKT